MRLKLFIVFVTFFFSFTYSQKISAEINYKDGTSKKGLTEPIEKYFFGNNKEIKFKENKDSKEEIILMKDISNIIYFSDDKSSIVAENLEIDDNNENHWGYKLHEGKIKLYLGIMSGTSNYWNNGRFQGGAMNAEMFIFQYKEEKPKIVMAFAGGISSIYLSGINKKQTALYFKDKCPQLSEAIENNTIKIKAKNIFKITEFFEKNCN